MREEDGEEGKSQARHAVKSKGGGLPDTEVRAAGVVAADGDDSARVRADVTWPGLRDVEGAVSVQTDARDGLDVDHWTIFLPDVPGK